MSDQNRAVKGTADVLPGDSHVWQFIEKKCIETAALFGFRETRVPVFEHTEVFSRGVGDTTDVVQKEMYTFDDKGGRSITLRPEFTAGVVRSMIEHGEVNGALPIKVCYLGACYRYEKPQAGRLREFHQFGVECLGAGEPAADAEVISLARSVLSSLGIGGLTLEINSIGCPACRAEYNRALREYFRAHGGELCPTCLDRLERNPMRILDCKSPVCAEIAKGAPVMLDYLCDDCREHFEGVKAHLTAAGIDYKINPRIVRGLDYYTKTVFEFTTDTIGAQGTVCGGGRYDGLTAQLGGPALPSLGFAMGLERLLMVMQASGAETPPDRAPDIYVAPMGEAASLRAAGICTRLRGDGFTALTDINGRGLKAQMKYADKLGAAYSVVLGDDEIASGRCVIKNMDSGETTETTVDGISDTLCKLINEKALDSLTETVENFR